VDSSVQAFRDLLQFIQPDEDNRKRNEANKVTLAAVGPAVRSQRLRDHLDNAWRALSAAKDSQHVRVNGFKTALVIMDEVIASLPQIEAEAKRMAAACDAFRKVLTNR